MKCSVNGCRICPGMWVAAALLLFWLVQSFFTRSPAPNVAPPATANNTGTEHVADAK